MGKEVLVVTRNFPPLVGGMERLMGRVTEILQKEYLCRLIGPTGCAAYIESPNLAMECPPAPVSAFLLCSLVKSAGWGAGQNYRFCLAGSGVTAPIAAFGKFFYRIPAVSFVHGLDIIADSRLYQSVFIPSLRKMDIVIANSRNTARLAVVKGIASDKIEVLCPGVDIPRLSPQARNDFLARHNLAGKKILLSVGRLVARKGLVEFLRYSFPKILGECPRTVLVVIGAEPKKSIRKEGGALRQIEGIVRSAGLSDNVRLLGSVSEETLGAAYQAADLFIFPAREIAGDVEGFGMVATEAASYGLPTVAFSAGGITEAVKHGHSGFLVAREDYREFSEVTTRFLKTGLAGVTPERCRVFAESFSWDNFGVRLLEIVSRLYPPDTV